jgi:hypothetical protein
MACVLRKPDAGTARRTADRAMRRRIPRVVRRPVVAVPAGAAERKFDHMGLAHDHAQLAAQRRDQRPVSLPGLRR